MKKQLFVVSAATFLTTLMFGSSASAVVTSTYVSNGQAEFIPNTNPISPVNPANPDPNTPVAPIDGITGGTPAPGTGAPLSIDFASSFNFGQLQISPSTQTYKANVQKFSDGTPDGPNYVQVTDGRGTKAGWKLSVAQDAQFTSVTTSTELTGAQITLNNAEVASDIIAVDPTFTPSTVLGTVVLDPSGATQPVVMASADEGISTWVYRFGSNGATGANSVDLLVPGTTLKMAEVYTTSITWSLEDTP